MYRIARVLALLSLSVCIINIALGECDTKASLAIPEGFGKKVVGSSGTVTYCGESEKYFTGSLTLAGLAPDHTYELTINCRRPEEKECNKRLPNLAGDSTGYLDFAEICTDKLGNYSGDFRSRKLENGDYDVKFFVKEKSERDWPIVLYCDSLFFTIK